MSGINELFTLVNIAQKTDTGEGEINCELYGLMDGKDAPPIDDPEGDDIVCDAGPADWKV